VQVFARALFLNMSDLHSPSTNVNASSQTESMETCHEAMQHVPETENVTVAEITAQPKDANSLSNSHAKMAHSTHAKSVDSSDCCIQDCSCSDSVCHSFSLLFSANSFSYVQTSQHYDFNLSFYISLANGPASPPPIV
jgi:hypothetical protein